MEHIFIRGSRIRYVIVPDMLKNAPMFKRIDPRNKMEKANLGAGSVAAGAPVRGRGRGRR
jgi:small nuclear ribonucleoprotein D3